MKAADIMTTEVVSVSPETDVSEVARLLLAQRISAVPVVDHDGHIVGMVSEADLMRRTRCDRGHHWWLSLFADDTAEFIRRHGSRAQDVMSCEIVSVSKDTTIAEIACVLETHAIKRVPVIEDGRLIGIVSRSDVLRGLASLNAGGNPGEAASDLVIRQSIIDLIKANASVSLRAVSIIVSDGVVYLWGVTETKKDREAVRVAAEAVAGPSNVHDYLNTLPQVLQLV